LGWGAAGLLVVAGGWLPAASSCQCQCRIATNDFNTKTVLSKPCLPKPAYVELGKLLAKIGWTLILSLKRVPSTNQAAGLNEQKVGACEHTLMPW
jgi:hypothetical protein